MAKKTRQEKVLLKEFDSNWQDSWLMFSVLPFTEFMALQKEQRSYEKQNRKLENEIKKIDIEIEGGKNVIGFDIDSLLDKKEKLNDKLTDLNELQVFKSLEMVKENLIDGEIFDKEVKQNVKVTKDNIDAFIDLGIIERVATKITGQLEKKTS